MTATHASKVRIRSSEGDFPIKDGLAVTSLGLEVHFW